LSLRIPNNETTLTFAFEIIDGRPRYTPRQLRPAHHLIRSRDDGREHDEHDTCPRLWCAVKGTKKPRRARCPFGVHISDFGGDKVSRTARSGSGAHHGVIIGEADEVDTVTAGALQDIVQAIVLAKEGRVDGASRDGPALKSTRRD